MNTIDWIAKLRHLLQTLAFCLTIAALQAFFMEMPYWVPATYSTAIAGLSWVLIDFGRHAFPSARETGWPAGAAGLLLPALGLVAGFLGGTMIGDWFCGYDSFSATRRPRLLVSVTISALAGMVITYYFYSVNRGRYLEQRMVQARREAAEMQLKLLESQLEPHMLFNTLANLRVLIGIDPPRAQAMLDRLIAFLRSTLRAARAPQHPLKSEFDRLGDYLALMQLRMGERLQVRLDLPADLEGAPVPPLLLQPLVENAIKHGLEPKVDGGRIEVRARHEGGELVLDVEDTGVGLADAAGSGDDGGVGVQLVRERLATWAGERAALTLHAATGGGTLARLRLPLTPGTQPA